MFVNYSESVLVNPTLNCQIFILALKEQLLVQYILGGNSHTHSRDTKECKMNE